MGVLADFQWTLMIVCLYNHLVALLRAFVCSTWTSYPRSYPMTYSRESTTADLLYISVLPFCNTTKSSCTGEGINACRRMRSLADAMSPKSDINFSAARHLLPRDSTANGTTWMDGFAPRHVAAVFRPLLPLRPRSDLAVLLSRRCCIYAYMHG